MGDGVDSDVEVGGGVSEVGAGLGGGTAQERIGEPVDDGSSKAPGIECVCVLPVGGGHGLPPLILMVTSVV